MITYTYKCKKCGEKVAVSVETFDIIEGRQGRVNQEKLTARIYEPRNHSADCDGELIKTIDAVPTTMWFGENFGKGKISKRFA